MTDPAEPNADDYITWLDAIWNKRLQSKWSGRPSLVVGILVCPGFAMMSLSGIVESLRHAGDVGDKSRQIECQWEILGDTRKPVHSSCGLVVVPTCEYLNPNDLDYIFIIGGLLNRYNDVPARHRSYLHAANVAGVEIVGVCTGSFILAEERLLKGHSACIHPYHQKDFQFNFPGHTFTTKEDFVAGNKVTTVPGGISILSLMTELIKKHLGTDRSAKAVYQLSISERRGIGGFERTGLTQYVEVADARVQKALVLIEDSVKSQITIPQIATQLGMSERHFSRVFAKEMKVSAKSHLIVTKLKYCMWLLKNSGNSITSIAYSGGFSSCSHFSTAFRGHFGISPKAARSLSKASTPPNPSKGPGP